jgi:mono/diheme cytochrome c family protein
MPSSMRNVILAAAALVATAACQQEQAAEPNPKPPAQQQQPAAQAPAQQQAPAAQQPAAGAGGTGAAAAAPAAEAELQVSDAAMADAKKTFETVCVTCHGATGEGNGPAAAGFPVKPRAFSDPEWQKSVTNDHIRKVIVQGGPAVGKSPLMPGNPQLADKPEVVNGLVKMIRDFGKKS